ncbi:hypothetical protein AB0937_29000 [Streptomyces sp. NPDC047880]|uniref:hypothetical protein n=1 Tax=Streptomyces sp. NPDC047880 TaxID=3155626 RepID=UPI003453AC8A
MRLKKVALAGAAAGVLALTATPASAAEVNWKAVSTDSTWNCGTYRNHVGSQNVRFKHCFVINSGGYAQSVLVVQNKASVAIKIEGDIRTNFGSDVDCAQTTLNPGFTRGCFGPTRYIGSEGLFSATSRLNFNGIDDQMYSAIQLI